MTGQEAPVGSLKQRLERKATFEAAVKELTTAVRATSDTPPAALDLVPRVHTLLKARYSNPAFWKAGLELFKAVEVGWVLACIQAHLPAVRTLSTFVSLPSAVAAAGPATSFSLGMRPGTSSPAGKAPQLLEGC